MSKTYDITLRCNLDQLPTILQVVQGHATLLNCQQTADQMPQSPDSSRKSFRYANGQRNKGITGQALLLRCLSEAKTSRPLIEQAFKSAGFSKSSLSPVLSKLLAAGQVRIHGNDILPIQESPR